MISVLLVILLAIILPFFLVDGWTEFNVWQKRIHIGRWKSRTDWQIAVRDKAVSWLKHTPIVPVSDEKRMVLWDMLRGKYGNRNIQSWQYAGLLFGLGQENAQAFYVAHQNIRRQYSVDNALLMYVLYKKDVLSRKDLIEYAQESGLVDQEGTVPYRQQLLDIRFVDTIGLLVPFLVACGYDDKALNQIKEYDEALLYGIFPPHAYDVKKHLPLGIYDWSRGLGWYILGITETEELDGNRERILRLANEMLKYQQDNGGLGSMFFSPSRIESSGTALLGILFVKAFEITSDRVFLDAAKMAEGALMRITRRNGEVDYSQGDTKGIGMYSNRFDIMPFVQGITVHLSNCIDKNETSFN